MYELKLQQKAKEDIKKIWKYSLNNFGIEQADKYYQELTQAMSVIASNPKIGLSCDYLRSGYRQYQINKHLVFYQITENTIRIIRVLHERMQSRDKFE